jgi:hypothetical protein
MDEQILDQIGRLAEQLDNSLFSYKNMKSLPDRIHLEGLSGTMADVRDKLAEIYKENGGTEDLNIQA